MPVTVFDENGKELFGFDGSQFTTVAELDISNLQPSELESCLVNLEDDMRTSRSRIAKVHFFCFSVLTSSSAAHDLFSVFVLCFVSVSVSLRSLR
jgi:hypothetical protein